MSEHRGTSGQGWRASSAWLLVRRGLRVVSGSNISRMAAALAYRTVFGLIPVLAIGVAVLGGFASDKQIETTVREVLDFSGLSTIAVGEKAEAEGVSDDTTDATGEEPSLEEPETEEPIENPVDEAPAEEANEPTTDSAGTGESASESESLDDWLKDLVVKVREVQFVAIGLTGFIMLIYAALSFMVEIERSANHIYRSPIGRSWVRRVTQYWTTLTLGTIFLVGTFYVGDRLTDALRSLQGVVGAGTALGPEFAGIAVSIAISFLLLLFLYMTIPNARVSLRCAAIGAFFAAVLWETGKFGFVQVVELSSYQRLYGVIALVPLFLLWVYITWIIVLSGLQISYVLQNFRSFAMSDDEQHGPVLVDPLMLVQVAVEVAGAFVAGRTAAVADVAKAIGLDEMTSLAMLVRLDEAGVLHRVPEGQEREAFALARPASEISAMELLDLAGRMAGGHAEELETERFGTLRRAQQEAAAGMSLADLMGGKRAGDTGETPTPLVESLPEDAGETPTPLPEQT